MASKLRMHVLPRSKSRVWWAVILCSLAAIGIFMVFEVLDLDGSDLYARIFQPPLSSQPGLVESEGAMRQGALAVHAVVPHPLGSVVVQYSSFRAGSPGRTVAAFRRHLPHTNPRVNARRAALSSLPSTDEPPSSSGRPI